MGLQTTEHACDACLETLLATISTRSKTSFRAVTQWCCSDSGSGRGSGIGSGIGSGRVSSSSSSCW